MAVLRVDDGHHARHRHAGEQRAGKQHVAPRAQKREKQQRQQREQDELHRREQQNFAQPAAEFEADQAAADDKQGNRSRARSEHRGGFQQRGGQRQPAQREGQRGKLRQHNRVFQQIGDNRQRGFQTAFFPAPAGRVGQKEKQRNQKHIFHQHVHGEIFARRLAHRHGENRVADKARVGEGHGKAAQGRLHPVARAQAHQEPAGGEGAEGRQAVARQIHRVEHLAKGFARNGEKHQRGQAGFQHEFRRTAQFLEAERARAHRAVAQRDNQKNRCGDVEHVLHDAPRVRRKTKARILAEAAGRLKTPDCKRRPRAL